MLCFVSCFWLSLPVQSIVWNDSSLKWPAMCWVWLQTLLTLLLTPQKSRVVRGAVTVTAVCDFSLWWLWCRGCERSDITKHVLVHDQPQHTCDICGKSFRHIKNKELHMKRSAWLSVRTHNTKRWFHFFVRAHVRAVLGVVILSVRPSVTRVDCGKTKWHTADILIPHERAITLLLWHQEWLVGDAPFPLKSAFKVTHPLRKTPTSTDFHS